MDAGPIANEVIKIGTDLIKAKLLSILARSTKRDDPSRMEKSLSRHLEQVANWSCRVTIYGMSSARDTDTATLPLTFVTTLAPESALSWSLPCLFRRQDATNRGAANLYVASDFGFVDAVAVQFPD